MNKKTYRARHNFSIILFICRRRLSIQEGNTLLRVIGGSGSRWSMTVPSTASRHYDTYTRRGGLAAVLRIKLMEVFYIS
jgi:hypothetical protein